MPGKWQKARRARRAAARPSAPLPLVVRQPEMKRYGSRLPVSGQEPLRKDRRERERDERRQA